jgi:hypothetical protein
MSEDPKPRRGFLSRFFSLVLFTASLGFAIALCFVAQPQDLSDLEGYGAKASPPTRELKTVIEKSLSGNYDLRLSEAEINGWLKHEVQLKQGGALAKWVKLENAAVRLEQDRAEVILVRSIWGKPFTTSMYIRIEQVQTPEGVGTFLHRDGGAFIDSLPRLKKGGRFGRLVVPQGLLLLEIPALTELKELFGPEIELGMERGSRISIEDGGLKIDPRLPGGENPNLRMPN